MRATLKIKDGSKVKEFTVKTREAFAPKQQAVESKKKYTRKDKHKKDYLQ